MVKVKVIKNENRKQKKGNLPKVKTELRKK